MVVVPAGDEAAPRQPETEVPLLQQCPLRQSPTEITTATAPAVEPSRSSYCTASVSRLKQSRTTAPVVTTETVTIDRARSHD